jgi:hypothetical protein
MSDDNIGATVSDRQLDIMRHALRISQTGREYRNHFDPRPKYAADCAALEVLGLMTSFRREWLPGPVYQCTLEGKRLARMKR